EAHPADHSGGEILNDKIAMRREGARDLDPFARFEIQQHTALALIPLIEAACTVIAAFTVRERRNDTIDIDALRALDANYLRAQMGELERAEWTLPHPAEVEHANAAQR